MKKGNNDSVYNQMQRMAELTVTMVLAGKMVRAKRLLESAEKLFLNGDYRSRNAVSNVYVYDVSTLLELHHYNVHTLLPIGLQKEYIKQINAF
ncbi:hypothetical protein [Dyadobacter sp. NIV53]|uniref:DUF7674 family protein n=1 Tax=Dyadobacter sp. NIV53 TaxID=2861765 RepID=UPI001C8811FF|nr:hypothetical protein [Dyadobacter sp. NIV53]